MEKVAPVSGIDLKFVPMVQPNLDLCRGLIVDKVTSQPGQEVLSPSRVDWRKSEYLCLFFNDFFHISKAAATPLRRCLCGGSEVIQPVHNP